MAGWRTTALATKVFLVDLFNYIRCVHSYVKAKHKTICLSLTLNSNYFRLSVGCPIFIILLQLSRINGRAPCISLPADRSQRASSAAPEPAWRAMHQANPPHSLSHARTRNGVLRVAWAGLQPSLPEGLTLHNLRSYRPADSHWMRIL